MRYRVDSKTNAEENKPASYPHGPVNGRAEVADDQEGGYSRDLVRGRYPRRLAAGQGKPSLDS